MKYKIIFSLLLIFISTHPAICAKGSVVDIQEVINAGGEVIIRKADGKTPVAKVRKQKNSSDEDDFVVDSRDDEDDDLDDDDAGTDAPQESQNSQQSFIDYCQTIDGTLMHENKECKLLITTPVEYAKIGGLFETIKEKLKICEKEYHYNSENEWEIMCSAGTLKITIWDVTCPDGQTFNSDSGKCDTVDSADAQPEQPADSAGTAPAEENPKSEPAAQANAPVAAESAESAETQPAPAPSGTQTSASRLKSVPENAEQCKEDIRVDVVEIVESQSPKTKLIPKSDWTHIEEQYIEYESQHESGDIKITAMEYLKREMVELYCDGVGDSNTAKNDAESAEPGNSNNANTDESKPSTEENANTDAMNKLINELKGEVNQIVTAFNTKKKTLK
ncbi:MAG: hypothetical protein IJL05_03600 [Alphaproteobacteria bacterium]|nr:hypothetical protein [Alphaproteobacteria bacterium]